MGSFGDEPSLTQVLEQLMEDEGVLETQLDDDFQGHEKSPTGTSAEFAKYKVHDPLDAPEQGEPVERRETLSKVEEMSTKVDDLGWDASNSKAYLASAFCTPEKKGNHREPVSSAKTGPQERSISDGMQGPGMLAPKPEAEVEHAFRTPEKKCNHREPVSSAKTGPQERSISDGMQGPGMLAPKPEADSESAFCMQKCDPAPVSSAKTGEKRSISDQHQELSSLPWEVLWPRLQAQGWRIDFGPRGTGRQVYYLPPGVFRGPGNKNWIHYFDSKKLVMQLIQGSPDKQRKLAEK